VCISTDELARLSAFLVGIQLWKSFQWQTCMAYPQHSNCAFCPLSTMFDYLKSSISPPDQRCLTRWLSTPYTHTEQQVCVAIKTERKKALRKALLDLTKTLHNYVCRLWNGEKFKHYIWNLSCFFCYQLRVLQLATDLWPRSWSINFGCGPQVPGSNPICCFTGEVFLHPSSPWKGLGGKN